MFTTNPTVAHAEDMQFVGAHRRTLFGPKPIPIVDDCWGRLFVYGQEYGPIRVVRARSWESAYEMVIDDLPTIDPEEVSDAFVSSEDPDAQGDPMEYELEEGYQYQSNFSGTGIVNVGHHEWMHELTDGDDIVPIFTPW